ncbi:FAD-dependent oxidoreductase [Methanoculleus chikugoensis]|uniref:NAD(P)-binding protein n=1 Tax=Methanoculleus chikugoensis TaxID=118126 RepID=UPI001FB3FB79|nr:NAD(P)-binding protein [Methanoculleus chikugoensis]
METTAAETPHPPLPGGNLETDVAVVGGGGIVGITAAVLLKRAGYAVTLIEGGDRIARGG